MRSDTVLDFAVFQLSPKHSRCELFVSHNGQTEKLASGSIQPFVNNLRVLEAQAARGVQSSIKLEVEKSKDGETWFTKGTLERFVQFVSNPEALERVGTYDLEMSQLEAARKLYSQGNEDVKHVGSDDRGSMADATKKELLRAIDLRLDAVKKDLSMAISNVSACGFIPGTVSKLQQFADRFGAHRLDEACSKFISLWQRRSDMFNLQSLYVNALTSQSSWGLDMPVNASSDGHDGNQTVGKSKLLEENRHRHGLEQADTSQKQNPMEQSEHQTQRCSQGAAKVEEERKDESVEKSSTARPGHVRRLSVQDRINLFESKQKENSSSGAKPVPPGKSIELRRLSSDVSSAAPTASEKSVLRRWSIVSDMSIDVASDKKLDYSSESPSSSVLNSKSAFASKESIEKDKNGACPVRIEQESASENLRMKNSTAEAENNRMGSGIQVTFITSSESSMDSNQPSHLHIKGGVELKFQDVQCQDTDVDVDSQLQRSSFAGRTGKKQVATSDKKPASIDSHTTVCQKPAIEGAEHRQESSDGNNDGNDGNGGRVSLVHTVSVGQENMDKILVTSLDQAQRKRQSKGYHGVDDELEMKANELEKLFADHKLRVPGDQSSSYGQSKHGETRDVQQEQSFSRGFAVSEAPHGSGDYSKLITPSNGDVIRRNFSDLSLSDGSKGRFYEKYMQKRDAKLREEWSSKGAEKETKLKSMEDALERSRSEMKAKLSASSETRNSLSSTRQCAEKFRSFNSRTSLKKFQHPIRSFQSEDEEDFSEHSDRKPRAKDKALNGNNAPRSSSQARKLQPNRNVSSVNPRTTTSLPKPSAKASNTNSGRRRSEKPLAQSVPNFADLKKENTKPSSLVAKTTSTTTTTTTTRTQGRNAARGKIQKIQSDDLPHGKQEKLRRSRSLRKSSSGNIEFTELSTLYSDDVLAPVGVDKERNHQRKIIDAGDDVSGFAREAKAAMDESENLKSEEYDELDSEVEVTENTAKEEEPEELETAEAEDGDDDVKPRMNEEAENDLPSTVPSTFHIVGSLPDSPGESPLSWSSNMQHPFGYPHENSDIDASVDSPIGSPASWSSRMRKKWGAAQNPVMAANSSQLQSRKDLTKGFKRLLKFGKKSRAAESFMDWVSVTTSEGDEDAEERRELANRSSDDLRKSRMGSLQSHLSEDGFNESEFNDQASNSSNHARGSSNKAARSSFFSLSTFRGKGNDSKPR